MVPRRTEPGRHRLESRPANGRTVSGILFAAASVEAHWEDGRATGPRWFGEAVARRGTRASGGTRAVSSIVVSGRGTARPGALPNAKPSTPSRRAARSAPRPHHRLGRPARHADPGLARALRTGRPGQRQHHAAGRARHHRVPLAGYAQYYLQAYRANRDRPGIRLRGVLLLRTGPLFGRRLPRTAPAVRRVRASSDAATAKRVRSNPAGRPPRTRPARAVRHRSAARALLARRYRPAPERSR